jgi:AcrR family transcriptional regulator
MFAMTEDKPPGGSIWTRPERSSRGPAPEHSRAEIASAGIAIADAAGLGAVTMRSVATAIGTGPASLYRYVANRDELLELMADQARGELAYDEESSGEAAARLLEFAREGRRLYLRHPWLLNVPAAPIPGPNAIAFIEYSLAALSGVDLPGPAKLETIGIFSGAVRLLAQTEIEQQRAGQNTARWQSELTAYLAQIAATGQSPHLAAALADTASAAPARQEDDLFERAMARILAALLPRHLSSPAFISPGRHPGQHPAKPSRRHEGARHRRRISAAVRPRGDRERRGRADARRGQSVCDG